MNKTELPFKVSIAKPCPARWADMAGDKRVRFCGHCQKHVYHLSAMTAAEATALMAERNGQMCVRVYQRADGTVLTEDCPVGVAQGWRRVKALVAGGIAAILLMLVNVMAFAGDGDSRPRGRVLTEIEEATNIIKDWAGLNPVVMGKMRAIPRPRQTSPPVVTLGEVCITSATNLPASPTNLPPAKK